ncbi:hypothetical protein [Sphingomicrobium lutaoense]|uniref:Uncharacterized protein n=1 Tax=Sphingomicrobium lutaoense TaxID=515949 RepID=A0A839Z1Y8_9SPHN|nr:hypothetical protein [Sphingomicrobium lutaoense]MBB3764578.1 hypothetical protein [Sphingomicrobium lutaoense]
MIRPFAPLIIASLLAVPAAAQSDGSKVQRVVACRTIADDAERLVCYDRESAALGAALESDEVVVVSREQAVEARRELFGFSSPNFAGLLGDEDNLDKVEVEVASAQMSGHGDLVVAMKDGSVWRQIDDRQMGRLPKAGTSATIEKAMMGSYEMKIDGRRSIKVRRIR